MRARRGQELSDAPGAPAAGATVGGGLAMAGVALQAMVRNILADPYLLGVPSGASTGAAATILFGLGTGLGPAR